MKLSTLRKIGKEDDVGYSHFSLERIKLTTGVLRVKAPPR